MNQLKQPLYVLLLFGLWLLSMIALPISIWVFGDPGLITATIVNVIVQAFFVVLIVVRHWGYAHTAWMVGIVVVSTLLVEAVGSHTGLLFGAYSYTDRLQPQLFGVPLLIPLAWLMMMPVAWAMASFITNHQIGWRFALWSAGAITAWDLFLDPQMVGWEFWVWHQPGLYFGIPLQNYVGWFGTALLLTALCRPKPLPALPLFAVYALIWILQTLGQLLFWGLPGPALFGFIGMGVIVWSARLAFKRQDLQD